MSTMHTYLTDQERLAQLAADPAEHRRTPKHPTARVVELFDPLEYPPPRNGEHLLLINPGGVLITGPWHDGCLTWGFKPMIPASVKVRM